MQESREEEQESEFHRGYEVPLFLEVGRLKSGKALSHPKLLKQMVQELLPLCFVLKLFLSKACTRYTQYIYSLWRKWKEIIRL